MTRKLRKNYRWTLVWVLLIFFASGALAAHSLNAELLNNLTATLGLASPSPTPAATKKLKPKRPSNSRRNAAGRSGENLAGAPPENLIQPLATTDFNLIGLNATVAPAVQTVPKNIPTAVTTSIQTPDGEDPAPIIASLNPNYRIRGELVGPSFTSPRTIEAPIGQNLPIPPLPNVGDHIVQNLRVVDITDASGASVAPVTPDSCGITVIERVLVTQVQVNEMTYDQIVQAGINITSSNYNFFNFTLGLATSSGTVPIQIPVAMPQTGGQPPIVGNPQGGVGVSGVSVPDIVPVMLSIDQNGDGEPDPPAQLPGGEQMQIPGVIVFPGRIGLLHQFFEAIVIVANGAPNGTPLVITNLKAKANLPNAGTPGNTSDDPLRIAATQQGGVQSVLDIHGLGPDGRYGTADDTVSFNPGQSGQATFLLEGLKEGLHTVNFDLEGTLNGLPIGPVNIIGSVPGAVLVKDARFGVTFTHPSIVRAGQEYDLGVTIFNSGDRNINGITLALGADSVSGATLIDTPVKTITQTIPRGGSATIKWHLRSNTTGAVTASYVKVGEGIEAGLRLVTGVGDRNVPLSPDSLILPDAVRHLPPDVVEAGRQMLGQAWSVANAPPGTLPNGVLPIEKQTVVGKAIEMGWAGLRADFGETRDTTLKTLVRDWLGENQSNSSPGFADALRNTTAGYYFFDVVGNKFFESVGAESSADFHKKLVTAEAARSAFISALVTQPSGGEIFGAKLNSPGSGSQSLGWGASAQERFGDLRTGASVNLLQSDPRSTSVNNSRGKLLIASKPANGNWSLELFGWADGNADVSVLAPSSGKNYRQLVFPGVPFSAGKRYRITFRNSGTSAPVVEEFIDGSFRAVNLPSSSFDVAEPQPEITGVVQVTENVIEGGDKFGRLVGVLYSKPMTKASVETMSRYRIAGGELASDPAQLVGKNINVTGANQNFGGRFSIIALSSPVGAYIKRNLTVNGATDTSGKTILGATKDIVTRVSPQGIPPGAYVTGRVMNADGTAVPNADVYYRTDKTNRRLGEPCGNPDDYVTIAYQKADANGDFAFDYVREGECMPVTLLAVNLATNSTKNLTSNVAYNGQHIILNAVFLARGNVQGTVKNGNVPLVNAAVSIIPELDVLNAKLVRTDSQGRYSATGVPVGGVTVRAVGDGIYSLASGIAGGTITAAGQTVTINVPTQDISGVIKGKVLDSGGSQSPIPNSLVVAYADIPGFPRPGGELTPVGYAFTMQDGSFMINNLPIGNISLRATDPQRGVTTSTTVQLTPQNKEVTGIIMLVSNGFGRVLGRVLNEIGQPIPNAVVQEGSQAVRADSGGNYALPFTREGNVNVSAFDPASGQRGSTYVSVRRGEDTTGADIIIRRPANLNGQVFITENGVTQPMAQVYVTVDGRMITQTDAQGRYTLNSVPSGSTLIRFVYPQRRQFVNTWVFLNPGETLTRNATFRPGKIRGRLTQPDGVTPVIATVKLATPIPSLQVGPDFGLPLENATLAAQTGTDGLFAFDNLNPGGFRLSASNVFFPVPVSHTGNLPPNGDLEINLSLVDTLAGKIHGRIYQPDGVTPVGAGVKVSLGGGTLADVTVRTNADGDYEFAEVFAAGGYALTATDPVSGKTNRIGITVRHNEDITVNLRLLGRGTLKVRAIDGGGNPLPGGALSINGGSYPNEQRFYELSPANNGQFEFTNLSEGSYAVSALYMGLGGRVSANVTTDGVTEVTVQVQPVGSVTGRVLMPDGTTPVGLADVTLLQNGRIIGFNTTSDSEEERGKFTFQGVPSGSFTIDVFDNRSGRRGRAAGEITAQGQIFNVDIKLLSLGAVSGQVTANGVPAQHALVRLSADGSGISATSRIATTDDNGNYRFNGIPVGRVNVSVSNGPGGTTGHATGNVVGTIEPLPETVINVALTPTVTVTGTVHKLGGEPFAGALVKVRSGGFVSNTVTGENGRYTVSFVPLGNVDVRVESPFGYDRGKSAVIVADQPGATLTANVTMTGTGNINGLATDAAGAPLTFGRVTFTNNDWGENISVSVPVQTDGTYSMSGLPSGDFNLKLTVSDRVGVGTAIGNLVGNQNLNQNLQLEPAGKIFGVLKAEDGSTPASGADVVLSLAKQGGGAYTFITHTDQQGRWEFVNLPLGTISVAFSDPNAGGRASVSGLILNGNGQELDAGTVLLDNTPIAVQSVNPPNGTLNVPRNSTFEITFSEAFDPGSVHSGSVRLLKDNSAVHTTRAISGDGKTVTLTPTAVLADSALYTIVVSTDVKDRNGFSLVQEFRSNFTTVDDVAPTVTQISPANGSIQIPAADTNVVVTASEALAADLNLSEAVQIKKGETIVGGNWTLNETRKIITFSPSPAFEENGVYTINVGGLRDAAGNVQAQAVANRFATTDTIAPAVDPLPIDGTNVRTFRPTITATYRDNASGINASTATLTLDGNPITSGISANEESLSYTSPVNLTAGSHTVGVRITDKAGNASEIRSATFTVADTVAPVVIAVAPATGAVQVPVDTAIVVTFNEELDASQQLSNVVKVTRSLYGIPISGAYSLGEDHKSIRFVPASLEPSHGYQIEVYGQKDVFGNVQYNRYTSYFTTLDNTSPVISSFKINGKTAESGMSVSTPRPSFVALFDDDVRIDTYETKLYLGRQGEPLLPVPASVNYNSLNYQPQEPLVAGQYVTKAVVQDHVGNQTSTPEITFTFSPSVPEILSVSPDYSYSGGNMITTIKGSNLISTVSEPDGTKRGLLGEYYFFNDFYSLGELKTVRLDSQINFDATNESLVPYIYPEYDAVRWRGKIIPRHSEEYTFTALVSGGLVLKINGEAVINYPYNVYVHEIAGTITLAAGQAYDIEIENTPYYYGYGYGDRHVAKLFWSSASQPRELVPSEQLRPAGEAVLPTVTVGGQTATVIGAVSGETDQIAIITPPAQTEGYVNVQVQNENGAGVVENAIYYYFDLQPPSVVSYSTGQNTSNVAPPARINVTFDEPLASDQNFNQILKVYNYEGNVQIPGSVTIDETGWRLSFVPENPLSANSAYLVEVSNYRDRVGNLANYASSAYFTTTDTIAPVISYLRPDQVSTINRRPTIEAEYSDAGSGIDTYSVNLTIDGQPAGYGLSYTAGWLSYNPPAPLAFGTHTIKLRIADKAGNTTEKISTFEIVTDTEPPTIQNLYLADRPFVEGLRTAQRRPQIYLSFGDNARNLSTQAQKLYFGPQGGNLQQVTPTTYRYSTNEWIMFYAPPQDVDFGFYAYRVELVDDSGNTLVRTVNFEVADLDVTPPQVTAVVPEDGAIQVNPGANVTFTFSEPLDPNQNFSATVQILTGYYFNVAGTYQLDASGTILTFTPEQPFSDNSIYNIYASGYLDLAGNQGQYFYSNFATTDTVAPYIQPGRLYVDDSQWIDLNGAETFDRKPIITVDYNDATTYVDGNSVVFKLDGQVISEGVSRWGIYYRPSVPLAYGQHTISVRVADAVGNLSEEKTETFTVSRDPRTPFAVEADTVLLWHLDEADFYSMTPTTPDAGNYRIYGKLPPIFWLAEQQNSAEQKSKKSPAQSSNGENRAKPAPQEKPSKPAPPPSSPAKSAQQKSAQQPESLNFSQTNDGRFAGALGTPRLTSIADERVNSLTDGAFTVEGWLRMSLSSGDQLNNAVWTPYTVWEKGSGAAKDFELLLTDQGNLKARIYGADGNPFEIEMPKAVYDVTDNRWHSLAMTVETNNNAPAHLKLYVDGQLRAEAAIPSGFGAIRRSGGEFRLGFGEYIYNARHDETRISSTAHSAETISKTYNSPELGLIVTRHSPAVIPNDNSSVLALEGYNLDLLTSAEITAPDGSPLPVTTTFGDCVKTICKVIAAVDASVPNGDVKLTVSDGTTTLSRNLRVAAQRAFSVDASTLMLFNLDEDGFMVNNAGTLGGSGEAFNYPENGRFGNTREAVSVYGPEIAETINSSFTGEFWMRAPISHQNESLLVYGNDYDGLDIRIVDLSLTSRGQLKATLTDINQLKWQAETGIGEINITDNQWHLISLVVARDSGSGQNSLKIYVDGAEKASAAMPAGFATLRSQANYRLYLNNFRYRTSPGRIDDFRLLNYARAASEIQDWWLGAGNLRRNTTGTGILIPKAKNPALKSGDFREIPANKTNVAGNFETLKPGNSSPARTSAAGAIYLEREKPPAKDKSPDRSLENYLLRKPERKPTNR